MIKDANTTSRSRCSMRGPHPNWARIGVFAVWLLGVSCQASPIVEVLIDPDSKAQTVLVETLKNELADSDSGPAVQLRFQELVKTDDSTASASSGQAPDLYVALGSLASTHLAGINTSVPRLFAFIPKAVWLRLESCCLQSSGMDSALFIDRPLNEQLQLVKMLIPDAQQIAVLLGPTSASQRALLEEAAEAEGLDLNIGQVAAGESVGPVLRRMVDESDVLLALPDPEVFNSRSLYSILLTTYSANLPLVGYSQGLVRAGAAVGLYLSPEDAGLDLARAIERFAGMGRLEPPGASPTSSLAVNQRVLRSLRIDTDVLNDLQRAFGEGGGQ